MTVCFSAICAVIILIIHCTCCSGSSFFPPGFTRLRWHSTTVGQEKLFIDGGGIFYKTLEPPHSRHSYVSSATFIIDLDKSWTNASVAPFYATKPEGFPLTRRSWLWWNAAHEKLQSFGGFELTPDNCVRDCRNTTWQPPDVVVHGPLGSPPNLLWEFYGPFNKSQGMWTLGKEDLQPPPSIASNQGSPLVSGTSTLLSLGGLVSDNYSTAWGSPGLAEYDFAEQTWENVTVPNDRLVQYTAYGEAAYLENFGSNAAKTGEKGVVIYIGGYSSANAQFMWDSPDDPLRSMSNILVFDVVSGRWANQIASGPIPQARWGFCAVGVEDKKTGEYDIFIHGGISADQTSPGSEHVVSYDEQLANIWVLSIPSFKWTEIPNSTASMRALHRCEAGLTRQMIVVGGDNPTQIYGATPDPWTNAIGVFDMGALKWADSYDANAPPYERAKLLKDANQKKYPSNWAEPWLKTIFEKQPAPTNNGGGLSGGAIAGITIGLTIFVVALAGGIWLWLGRRRRNQKVAELPAEEYYKFKSELDAIDTAIPVGMKIEPVELNGEKNSPQEMEGSECPPNELDSEEGPKELESQTSTLVVEYT